MVVVLLLDYGGAGISGEADSTHQSQGFWHVTPVAPNSYSKRDKFLASTYREAEFWGRPNDTPERVTVENPLIGDEETIERTLLGRYESKS